MDFNTLRYNLQQPYLQSNWQQWLQFIFGQQISIETQPEKIVVQKGNAKSIERFASIKLSDDKSIAVLDIKTTKDVQIARNRVALREIVFKLIDQDKYHGLVVFYHSEDISQLDYRLSFISNQTSIDEDGNISTQSTNAKRYSFILGVNESCNTATNRLLDLKNRVPKFKAFELQKGISLKDLTEAFSVEALNNEFFKKYKEMHYKRFWEYIANNETYANVLLNKEETDISKQQKPIRDFVKKMLGRIVFLHFLQKKGWMGCPANSDAWIGGDKMFMLNLFENSIDKENFYSKILTTLFYETLNKKRKGDVAAKQLTLGKTSIKIPFLNGGLFDDDALQTNNFNFPVEYFKDLFDFFSQYNFTIDENSPEEQEVGIDPEMLGHIFENLLEENKDKGAFYTPKEIVHYMCQESLIQYLRTHLPECTEDESDATKAIEIFIRKDNIGDRTDKKNYIVANAKRIEAILDKVKICDPAIGSGAFPMGMLQEIFKAKTTLDLTLDNAHVKKEIIQNSIYGVDIEKGAVDIARLRFWLSLVVDEDVPQPLPNLDYKIMQGNSLLESFEEVDLSTILADDDEPVVYAENQQVKLFEQPTQTLIVFNKVDKQDLQKLINLYFDFEESTKTKYKTKGEIKRAINTIIEGKLIAHFYLQKLKYENAKTKAEDGIKNNSLTSKKGKGYAEIKLKNIARLKKEIETLDLKINHLQEILQKLKKWETEDKERPYFLWHTYFKDVFDKGGFDIVIGNPPYIGHKGRQKDLFRIMSKNAIGLQFNNERMDIFYYFFHNSINHVKLNGIITFITTNYFLTADSAIKLRSDFKNRTQVLSLVNFNEIKLFENAAGQHNLITMLTKAPTANKTCNAILSKRHGFVGNYTLRSILEKSDNQTHYLRIPNAELFDGDKNYIRIPDVSNSMSIVINSILLKMAGMYSTVGKAFKLSQGIVTGIDKVTKKHLSNSSSCKNDLHLHDGVFIVNDNTKILINESEVTKPWFKNSDIKKYVTSERNKEWVIHIKSSTNLGKNSNILKHLQKYREYIEKRNYDSGELSKAKKAGKWWALSSARSDFDFDKPKIVSPQRSYYNCFAYTDKPWYASADVYFITASDNDNTLIPLLGILNSKLVFLWLYSKGKRKGEMLELYLTPLSEIPLPLLSKENQENINSLVTKILSLKSTNSSSIYYENKIDALVFHLYGLTEVEMSQVLDTFKDLDAKDRTQIVNEYKKISNNKFKLEI
jgi:adenine-specific DNA-methyltransferase